METKGKSLMSPHHKLKLQGVSLHLLLSHANAHYLLLLLDQERLALFSLQSLTLISTIKLAPTAKPLLLAADHHANILLAHTAGLSIWTFAQVKGGIEPMQKITIEWTTPPTKLLALGRDQYVAVCGKRLKFLGLERQQGEADFAGEFVMSEAQMSHSSLFEDSYFVLVPSTTHRYPYVFTPAELKRWESAGFLEHYVQTCMKYYLEDESLPKEECVMSLAADLKAVCVLTAGEMFILEWRGGHGEIGVVLSLRMRFKTGSSSSPLACHFNASSGEVAFARRQRAGSLQPLEYSNFKKTVKQPKEGFINVVHHTGRDIVLMRISSPTDTTKIYVISAHES